MVGGAIIPAAEFHAGRFTRGSLLVTGFGEARQACVALLAQQGLRPTSAGGHYAIEEVIRAQFGSSLRAFGGLRRRRNELEYPPYPTEQASPA